MTNILLVLLSVSVIATIGTILYHFVDTSYQTETAIRATADESKIFDGVYVRNETVLTYSGSGAVSYQVPDGGKIASGDVIAEVYPDESAIESQQKIDALQEKLDVLERISNPGTLEQAQPADLSRQITQYYKEAVGYKDQMNLTSAKEAEQQFLEAYSTYQIVISKGSISFADQISSLNSEIADLKAGQSAPVGTVTSDASAYFVSHVDGYETTFSAQHLDEVTPEELSQASASPTKPNQTEDLGQSNVIGKSIAEYGWYMMGMIDNKDQKYQVGDQVTIRLLNASAEAPATIQELRTVENSDQVMVVLYSDTLTSDFVQNRTDHVEMILGEYEGIKVPRDAIRFKDVEETETDEETGKKTTKTVNARGVYVQDGEKIEFRRLDVIYEGKDYVLSKLHADDGYLMLYDSIIVEGIDAIGN